MSAFAALAAMLCAAALAGTGPAAREVAGRRLSVEADGTLALSHADGRIAWRRAPDAGWRAAGLLLRDIQLDAHGRSTAVGRIARAAGPAGAQDILIFRLDVDGRLLWQTVYRESAEGTQQPWSLALGADGSAWVAGTMAMDTHGNWPELPLLLHVDAGGRPSVLGVGPLFGGCTVTSSADSGLTLAGPGRISRFTADGTLRWTLQLPEMAKLSSLRVDTDGSIVASGPQGVWQVSRDGKLRQAPALARAIGTRSPAARRGSVPVVQTAARPGPASLSARQPTSLPASPPAAQRLDGRLPTTPCTSQSMPAI